MTDESRQAPPERRRWEKPHYPYYPSVCMRLRLCGDQPADHHTVWPKPLLDTCSFLGQRQLVSRRALKAPCEDELRYRQATPNVMGLHVQARGGVQTDEETAL